MKQRSIGKMFLLSIVTLGIYRLYWFAKTRSEMMSVNKDVKIPPVIWLIAPVLLMVVAVAFFLGVTIAHGSTDSAEKAMTGLDIAAIVFFYAAIIAVPLLMAIWLWKYSKGVEIVTNEKMSFAISLLILLAVPDGIDILILQDAFNKIAAKTAGPVAPAAHWQAPA